MNMDAPARISAKYGVAKSTLEAHFGRKLMTDRFDDRGTPEYALLLALSEAGVYDKAESSAKELALTIIDELRKSGFDIAPLGWTNNPSTHA